MPELTDANRRTITQARKLALVHGIDGFKEHTGETELAMAYGVALGEAQHLLAELVGIAERLAGS